MTDDRHPSVPEGARFDDEEIQRILQRAAELQERRAASRMLEPSRGLTLSELRDVAAEAGIDPELIDVAAVEVRAPADAPGAGWRGSPTSLRWRLEQRIRGRLPQDRMHWVLRAIRGTAGDEGTVDHVAGEMVWTKSDGSVTVAVGTRGADTRIEVSSDRSRAAGGWTFYMSAGVGFFGGAVLAGVVQADGLLAVLCFVVMAALGWLGGQAATQRYARSHEEYLSHILAAATDAAVDGVSVPPDPDER